MRQSILGAIALAICASHVGINDRALADEPVVSCTLMKEWPPHSAFSQGCSDYLLPKQETLTFWRSPSPRSAGLRAPAGATQ